MTNKSFCIGHGFKLPLGHGPAGITNCVRLTLKAPYPKKIDAFGTTVKSERQRYTEDVDFSRMVLLIRRTPTTRQREGVIPRKHTASGCCFICMYFYKAWQVCGLIDWHLLTLLSSDCICIIKHIVCFVNINHTFFWFLFCMIV